MAMVKQVLCNLEKNKPEKSKKIQIAVTLAVKYNYYVTIKLRKDEKKYGNSR